MGKYYIGLFSFIFRLYEIIADTAIETEFREFK